MNKEENLILIAVRLSSKRLPKKALLKIKEQFPSAFIFKPERG